VITGVLVCLLAVFDCAIPCGAAIPILEKRAKDSLVLEHRGAGGTAGSLGTICRGSINSSTVALPQRHPQSIKFLHPLKRCLIILPGAVWRRVIAALPAWRGQPHLEVRPTCPALVAKSGRFEKKWTVGTLLVLGAQSSAWLILNSDKTDLWIPIWTTTVFPMTSGTMAPSH